MSSKNKNQISKIKKELKHFKNEYLKLIRKEIKEEKALVNKRAKVESLYNKLEIKAELKYYKKSDALDKAIIKEQSNYEKVQKALEKARRKANNSLPDINYYRQFNKIDVKINELNSILTREKFEKYYLPKTGKFYCYKKVLNKFTKETVIIKLKVDAKTKRLSFIGQKKCRVASALVIEIVGSSGKEYKQVTNKSGPGPAMLYKVGVVAKPDKFDTFNIQCSNGIHVFKNKADAKTYLC